MPRIIDVTHREDLPPAISGGPVGLLLEYHNLGRPYDHYDAAQLLIGMCMDNRKTLRIPENFAFILRSGGANLKPSQFKVSYAISIGGVRAIALIAHTQCGMANLRDRKDQFIEGLVHGAGWERAAAEEHFAQFAPIFEIGDEISFALSEAARLARLYPFVQVVPLLYKVEDNRLYLLAEA
jgi:carbonic anhydrase